MAPEDPTKLHLIANQIYKNQPIQLDNNRFLKCQFIGCELRYGGGPFQLDECHVAANTLWKFEGVAGTVLQSLKACGWHFSFAGGAADQVPSPSGPIQ